MVKAPTLNQVRAIYHYARYRHGLTVEETDALARKRYGEPPARLTWLQANDYIALLTK